MSQSYKSHKLDGRLPLLSLTVMRDVKVFYLFIYYTCIWH